MQRYVDVTSALTIAATFLLFGIAIFVKGLTHDLLLEGGVFLVSLKLIIGGYKNTASTDLLLARPASPGDSVARLEHMVATTGRPPAA